MTWILTVFLFLSLSECKRENANKSIPEKNVPKQVLVFQVQKGNLFTKVEIPTELTAWERAEIYARMESYVKKYNVDIGDIVKKGQTLAVLDAPEMQAKVQEAEAKHREATSKYNTSQDRFQRLLKASQTDGAVSESELIQAKNEKESSQSVVESTNALKDSLVRLQSYLVIQAPFSGKITQRNINIGDLVGPNTSKKPIFVVERLDSLRLRVPVPEKISHMNLVKNEMEFSIQSDPEQMYKAIWKRKSGSIDPNTRTELWEFEYNNLDNLKPGMFVIAKLSLQNPRPSFLVPKSSVVTSQERKFVVRKKDGFVEWIDIEEGSETKEHIEIFGNLQEGDTLMQKGNDELKEGEFFPE